MKLSDLKKIAPTLLTDFDDFWNVSILEGELKNKNSSYFVVKNHFQIIAFGGFWKSVDDVHLTNIVVKKNYRHQGIASMLLNKIIDEAKNTKKQSITLEVNENNTYAKKLYLKHGFKIVGNRKNYYNNNEAAIIMTLNFN